MNFKANFSILTLLAANIIPLVGALFFGWNAVLILALFWIENVIIGAFNLLKILSVAAYKKHPKALFIAGFFIVHYGAFCAIHGSLLWSILGLEEIDKTRYIAATSIEVLALYTDGVAVMLAFIEKFKPEIYVGLTALLLTHLVSFIEHFILRGDIYKTDAGALMAKPYGQIVVLHIGLILGAVAVERLGSPIWLLVIIIVFKLVMDFAQHIKRHNKDVKVTANNT